MSMEPKLRNLERDLVAQLKAVIESEVEKIGYKTNRQDYSVSCFLYMKNGMIIEGSALYLPSTPIDVARNMARRSALKTLSVIQQYIMADDLYIEAGLGCGETQFKNQLKGKAT